MNRITNEMIERAQYGDIDALNQILDIIAFNAYYRACKSTRNVRDSEDCVQGVLIKITSNLPKYNFERDYFVKWCNTIIENEIRNINRTNIRFDFRTSYENDYTIEYEDINGSTPEQQAIMSDLERHLGEEDYKLIYLKLKCKYTFEELEVIFNCSLRTIKRRYQKVVKRAMAYMEVKDEK